MEFRSQLLADLFIILILLPFKKVVTILDTCGPGITIKTAPILFAKQIKCGSKMFVT